MTISLPTRQDILSQAGLGDAECSSSSSDVLIQVTSWHACDEVKEEEEEEGEGEEEDKDKDAAAAAQYTIYAFGVDPVGSSVCVRIDGYTPFFFVKIGSGDLCKRFASFARDTKSFKQHVDTATVLVKKDYWGFTDDAPCPFVRLTFKSLRSMRISAAMLRKQESLKGFMGGPVELYESNIDPLLQFMHIRKLSPAGWLHVPRKSWRAIRASTCDRTVCVRWTDVGPPPVPSERGMAPMIVASFDLECNSAHGDFPMAIKDYSKLAYDLTHKVWASLSPAQRSKRPQTRNLLGRAMRHAFEFDEVPATASSVSSDVVEECVRMQLKTPLSTSEDKTALERVILDITEDVYCALLEENDAMLLKCLNNAFERRWPVRGDPIIQIGTTYGVYGGGRPPCSRRIVFTMGTCAELEGTDVHVFEDEKEMLLAWQSLVRCSDPDIILGYNIFGFDFAYLYERATELLGSSIRTFQCFGRLNALPSEYMVKNLSSSALGDNELKYIDMHGRVLIDLMKVVQRDHRLDSYKLDSVAEHFLKERKDDVSPNDIFRLQRGSAEDRARIAKYCVQDCELCNRLASKLEIIANNVGMANVCIVPLTYIFMRGQGIKIFSLVAKVCRDEGFLVPARVAEGLDTEDGYEGAIVLEPQTGMYLDDPVCVLDYNSLYPSSMISHNLSHNTLVLNSKQYGNVPGVKYVSISYDVNGVTRICRYATTRANGEPYVGVLPMILQRLLAQRKATRKQLAASGDAFERAVLDGLQNAYKVTANSLYGQMGARTSQLYLKDLAACTTAVGRSMILLAKSFVESNFGARVVYGDSVTGYTPIVLKVGGRILLDKIENIAPNYGHGNDWISCGDKESFEIHPGVSVWTSAGWTDLERVIRHRLAPHKSILRITTRTGVVDVTDEHSLLGSDHAILDAKDVRVGQALLHRSCFSDKDNLSLSLSLINVEDARIMGAFMGIGRCTKGGLTYFASKQQYWSLKSSNFYLLEEYCALCKAQYPQFSWAILPKLASSGTYNLVPRVPDTEGARGDMNDFISKYRWMMYDGDGDKVVPVWVLNSIETVRASFLKGLVEACDGVSITSSQISSASVFMLASSLGYTVSIDKKYRMTLVKTANHPGDTVESVERIYGYGNGYVYDLTTKNHEFGAGIGNIIVHNTDSIFVVFPHRNTDLHRLADTIQQGQEMSTRVKPTLPEPHNLEYEKTFFPFILLSKKRYMGLLYGNDATAKPVQRSMGIALKRRDYAPIVKTIYGGVIDILLTRRDVPEAVEFLKDSLNELASGRYDLSDLVLSKTLRSSYKQPHHIAHWVLAQRMRRRDPGSAPQVNERIPYVFVEPAKPDALMGDRIEHLEYVKAHPKEVVVDTLLYIKKQIQPPCIQLLAIALEQVPGYVRRSELPSTTKKAEERRETLREGEVEKLIFHPVTYAMGVKQRARQEMRSRSNFIAKGWLGAK